MPGSRGVSHLTGRGSAGPSPSRRRARFRPPRGLARTHAAAGRPFLSIFALAAFCAPHMPLSATRTPFTHPVRPFPLPVRTPRARAQFFAPPLLGLDARARPFPPRRLCARPPPPVAVPGAPRRRRPPAQKGAGPPPPLPGPSPDFPQRTAAFPVQPGAGGVREGPSRPLCSRYFGAPCPRVI